VGQNTFLRWQDFCSHDMLETNFLGLNTVSVTQKIFAGALPQNATPWLQAWFWHPWTKLIGISETGFFPIGQANVLFL